MSAQMVVYCFKWNQADGVPGEVLTEAEAKARDSAGEEYMAVVPLGGGAKRPTLVTLVWKTGVAVVTFLDEPGRKSTEYTFMRRTSGKLFLVRVLIWTYPDDRPGLRLSDASRHETFYYREDGHVKRVIKDKVERVQETVEHSGVPVEANWEPVPTFGDYASIARFDRHGLPAASTA